MIYAEILILIIALSVDSLAAAVSYGLAKMRIGFSRSLIISLICSAFLLFSAGFGSIISAYISENITRLCGFAVLFVTGLIKLLQKPKEEAPENLSLPKTVVFAASMSIDGLAAGFGAGLAAESNLYVVFLISALITFLAVYFGNKAGLKLNKRAPAALQRLGGAVIMLLAFCKLF